MIKVKVDEIIFDFNLDDEESEPVTEEYAENLVNQVSSEVYTLDLEDPEDDDLIGEMLADKISNQTGWCISNLWFQVVPV
jgi:hypothetical protein